MIKNPPANEGDTKEAALISGLGRSSQGGHGNPFQYSCLEDSMTEEPGGLIVHGVAKSPPDTTEQSIAAIMLFIEHLLCFMHLHGSSHFILTKPFCRCINIFLILQMRYVFCLG